MSQPPELTPYHFLCVATGHFFLNWAQFEGNLAAGLKVHLFQQFETAEKGQRAKAARIVAAIYGGQRMKAARDTTKRLAKLEGATDAAMAFFERVFAHVGQIEEFRDKLAHQSVEETDEAHVWRVHDVITTRALVEPKVFEFRTDAVFAAAADLKEATHRVAGFLLDQARGEKIALTPPTWQYKPSMLKPLPKSKVPSALAPRHLPQSSGE